MIKNTKHMKQNFTNAELSLVKATFGENATVRFNNAGNIKITFPDSKEYKTRWGGYYQHNVMRITKNDGKYVLRRITSDHPYVMFRNSHKTSGHWDSKAEVYTPANQVITPEDNGQFDTMIDLLLRYCKYQINKMNRA